MLLGLNGYATAGKDAVADILVRKYGYVKHSFSDPLMESLLQVDPWVHDPSAKEVMDAFLPLTAIVAFHGWTYAKTFPDVRRYLQKLGTEGGRDIHGQDCWVNLMSKRLDKAFSDTGHRRHVITNVRFHNEALMVARLGGIICRVERPGTEPAQGHVSDTAAIPFATWIENDGDLAALETKVDAFHSAWGIAPEANV